MPEANLVPLLLLQTVNAQSAPDERKYAKPGDSMPNVRQIQKRSIRRELKTKQQRKIDRTESCKVLEQNHIHLPERYPEHPIHHNEDYHKCSSDLEHMRALLLVLSRKQQ